MSDLVNLTCESCGADLVLKQGETSIKCGFCGTLNKPSSVSQNPSNKKMTLLLNAVESENWDEVAKYSQEILEDDPGDFNAWFYKGAAAGWNSRHIDDPSKEIMNCFRNAFANAEDEDLNNVMDMFATNGTDLLLALARGSRNFAQQHGYMDVGDITMNSWQEDVMNGHISKIFGYINAAHLLTEINRNDRVEKLNPAIDALFLKLYAFLYTKISFEGTFTKKNPFNIMDATFQFIYDENSEYGIKWVPRIEEILTAFKNEAYSQESLDDYMLDESNFEDPRSGDAAESEAAGGGCFIATAVYGTDEHFDLIVLRSFRDNFLSNYRLGKKFIEFYYKYGPNFANKVSQSLILKKVFSPLVNLGVMVVRYFRIG